MQINLERMKMPEKPKKKTGITSYFDEDELKKLQECAAKEFMKSAAYLRYLFLKTATKD
jgi:hypothetical protein